MFRSCLRGIAVVCLAVGMCLPALAQDKTSTDAREFTPAQHLMHDVIASYFGLSHTEVMDLNGRGYSYEDIATAANVAARSGHPIADVIAMHDRGMDWTQIASQLNVSADDIYRSVQPVESRVAAARETMPGAVAAGESRYAMPNTNINWSHAYTLTPLEMKRLRAMGLSDSEVYVAANAAHISRLPVDYFVQEIMRGWTTQEIADSLAVPASDLEAVDPMWTTPEWQRAVREGSWTFGAGMTSASGGGMGSNAPMGGSKGY